MITFEQIQKANEGMTGIDVKGKNYVMVPQRVKAFRKLYPEGFINTKLLSLENGVCVMQTEVGYYQDGNPVILGTGMAFERQESSFINRTSYIENCETSAVGRALGFLGLGIDGGGICSAEELANALGNQEQPKATVQNQVVKKADAPAEIKTAKKVPAANPVKDYLKNEIAFMREAFEIPDRGKMLEKFAGMRQALIDGGVIPDVDSDHQTMEQAKQMISAMYANFKPSGDQK